MRAWWQALGLRLVAAFPCMEAMQYRARVEAAPNEVSRRIVERTTIPVIGCGAGPACHGQIVVLQDLLGLTDWQPAFAKPIVRLGDQVAAAAGRWIAMVATSQLGEHPYRMPPAEAGKF